MNKDANKGQAEMGDTKSYSAISANGNPLSIRRSGLRQNGTFGPVDDLPLSYDGCQLSAVEERAAPVLSAATLDLKRGSSDFAYNDNGALTMDGTINGGALAIGSVKQDAVSGLSQQLTAIDGELKSKISRDDATSEIEQTANELNVRITGLNDNLQLVTKSYQVGDDGLVIGETGNPIRLKLANDTLQFLRDNVAELEITADGVVTKRITTDALIIGNVIFKKDDVGDVTIY